ncbi:MAG: ATP-dependent Clp protease ATP-binding subunit [Candidatus Scalindua rubra]|uniref:ATP-dependent protease Clp (Chain B) n=1 Tax=Candidatus Scalindua brodae TaxID=237368 RepID=A0A0B0EJN9_9BACT|nr:MAG: ATP-dependent protease Clp (chain B) [Candidatus Scalindua brodae]MBZ0108180.1 ATP-dependent Clp protease ATP-binding subunit [Candidatus Scalindua rubra]TWU34659.1 Negative regulator of genetic competence ClpC/MecB [Candidatus Brocadiaceae bacterium S225]
MLQKYIRYCTRKVLDAVNIGTMELVNMGHTVFTTEFVLLGLLVQNDSTIITIMEQLKLDTEGFKKRLMDDIFASLDNQTTNVAKTGNIQLVISSEVDKVFESALQESKMMGDKLISTEALFLALFNPQSGKTAEILKDAGLDQENARTAIKEIRGGRKVVNQDDESKLDVLKEYTLDLLELARQGELDPVIGREKEIERVIQILSRRKKNNPVLIGEAGVGKTVIVEGLAQQIVAAEVPQSLLSKRILSLDMAALIAGAGVRGEFEGRLKSIRDTIIDSGGRIILFIDELHTVVGVGGGASGGMGAPDILKPALARGQLQLIGATTYDDYRKYIESDRALARRFQTVQVNAPGIEDTKKILEGLKPYYEKHHNIDYTPESLDAAARLSERYITDRAQPDKAIDLLDEAGSKKHLEMHYTPPDLKKLENEKRAHTALKMEAFERQDFEEATKHHAELQIIEEQLATEKEKWQKELKEKDASVTSEDIAGVVSNWTGIPASRMLEGEADKLAHMEEKIHERIVAQEAAVGAIADAIRRNRAGLREASRPIGTFLFLGPTGVGKTELAKTLAEFLFDDETHIVRLDMSEYMERHEVAKLIGAPPGYVGYGEGGQLTERIRRVPYAVVLLDEVEKAHPDVFNMLLQVLDEGRLTDAQGHVVSFRNTIIIGTSNIGSEKLAEKHEIGFKSSPGIISHDEAKDMILSEVKKYFKPEFLNRLDDMIVFHSLTKEHISHILEILLNRLIKRLKEEGIYLEIGTEIKEKLVTDGYEPKYGARPLKRAIEREIENKLSLCIVNRQFQSGDKIKAIIKDKEIAFVKISV